jgi:hypothetical protein
MYFSLEPTNTDVELDGGARRDRRRDDRAVAHVVTLQGHPRLRLCRAVVPQVRAETWDVWKMILGAQ